MRLSDEQKQDIQDSVNLWVRQLLSSNPKENNEITRNQLRKILLEGAIKKIEKWNK